MKKLRLPFIALFAVVALNSCSENDQLNNEIYEEQYLLNSFELNKATSGDYTLNYTTAKDVTAEEVKSAKGNTDEIILYRASTKQASKSYTKNLQVQDSYLVFGFNDTAKKERTSVTVIDASAKTAKGGESMFLESYSIANQEKNTYQLTFSVRNNVSVVYKYNDAEGIYEIHLARDFSATTSEFNVTYTKEIGNALKIDFVNHIPTSESKDAEVIERKPRIIIDTFQEE